MRQLAAPSCDVTISDFLLPATIGTAAGVIAGLLARGIMDGERSKTKDAAAHVIESAVFLAVGGMAFVLRARRAH